VLVGLALHFAGYVLGRGVFTTMAKAGVNQRPISCRRGRGALLSVVDGRCFVAEDGGAAPALARRGCHSTDTAE
jgi:hypothetical protein